jgi:hypothetical protein
MSNAEVGKTAEEEEKDMIEESMRTAAEETRVREQEMRVDEELLRQKEENLTRFRGARGKEAKDRRREERLGEIAVILMSIKCPGPSCPFRFERPDANQDSFAQCKCLVMLWSIAWTY